MVNLRNPVAPRLPRIAAQTWLMLPVAVVALMSGLMLSLGDKLLDLMLFGTLASCFLLFLPLPFVMVTLIVTTLLLAGTLEYFGGIKQAQWIPFLMALALYARLPLEMLRHRKAMPGPIRNRSTPILYWFIAIYLILIAISAMANQVPIVQALVGAKSYIFFWSFLFLMLAADIPPEQLDSFWKSIIAVALFQLPFVLYQHFVIMRQRAVMWGFDAVVGTFGGNPNGGGANSTLLLYMLVAALYATALRREGLLKRRWWLATLALSSVVVALGETKVAVVLIPAAFCVVYWDYLKKNPRAQVSFAAVMAMAVSALLAVYQLAYWKDAFHSTGLTDGIEKSISYVIDPDHMNRKSGEVGRLAALSLWWQDPNADAINRSIGYGPGASRSNSSISIGEVARRYVPFSIDANAAAVLLWDLGVIGLICFSTILASGALLALQVADWVAPNSPQRAGLRTAAAVLVCMFIMIPYNRYVVDQAAVQILMVFCLAYAAYWHRISNQRCDDKATLAGHVAHRARRGQQCP